jgi:hypothetical protein
VRKVRTAVGKNIIQLTDMLGERLHNVDTVWNILRFNALSDGRSSVSNS